MAANKDPMIPDGDVNPIDTDYQIGQDNIVVNVGPFGLDIHNRVFAISGLAVIAFVLLTLVFQSQVEPLFSSLRGWLTTNLDWFFISAANIFVIICLVLIFTPLGRGYASAGPKPHRITATPAGFPCCLLLVWVSA
jgi:BCCT family betaine/carnitine transporter